MFYEVVLDPGETANKCTILPLAGRPHFDIVIPYGQGQIAPLKAPILLHHEGEELTATQGVLDHGVSGIAAVDCVWKQLNWLLTKIPTPLPRPVRIPAGFVSAYPRRNLEGHDPEAGLATIEALFTASALLGTWDPTLFSKYYFGREFIEINLSRFLELGVSQAADLTLRPHWTAPPRTSASRKSGRGKFSR